LIFIPLWIIVENLDIYHFLLLEALAADQGDHDYFEVMDMTLPGLVSQESIRRGGEWLEVPDSRGW
jgi:hypothetical protein